jgi:hypothetical protein
LESSMYIRLANAMDRRGYRLILSGYLDFTRREIAQDIGPGSSGIIRVLINLPRFDYLSGYLKDFN